MNNEITTDKELSGYSSDYVKQLMAGIRLIVDQKVGRFRRLHTSTFSKGMAGPMLATASVFYKADLRDVLIAMDIRGNTAHYESV